MKKAKNRIYEIIQIGNRTDFVSKLFDYFITAVIILNLISTMLSTFDELSDLHQTFEIIELVTVIIFSIEYVLRLWTSDLLFPKLNRGKALLAFVFSFYGIIDLLTFLPFYLPFFFPGGIVAFRMFRVIRIFRLFKINAQYDAFNVILEVINERKNQIISSMVLIFIFLIGASVCMYDVEHQAQPEVFRNAFSGMWWAVSALLTVGYGDIFPITPLGQVLAILIAFLGVGMVAIPTGIISAGFVAEYTKIKTYRGAQHELQFVVSQISEDHPIANLQVKDISLPPELLLVMIIREDKPLIPRGTTRLMAKDKIVIGAKNYRDDIDIDLTELIIDEENPWIGCRVRELEFADDEILVMINRYSKTIIPNGSTLIKNGDRLMVFKQPKK